MDKIDYSSYPIQRGAGMPPAPKKRGFKIWSTPPGEQTTLMSLVKSICIVWTHWHKGIERTIFCGGNECLLDHETNAPEWSGYLLVRKVGYVGNDPVVLWHITPGCARSCPVLADQNVDLRRARIRTRREGKTLRRPVSANLDIGYYRESEMPRDYDVFTYLVEHFSAANNEARRKGKQGKGVT